MFRVEGRVEKTLMGRQVTYIFVQISDWPESCYTFTRAYLSGCVLWVLWQWSLEDIICSVVCISSHAKNFWSKVLSSKLLCSMKCFFEQVLRQVNLRKNTSEILGRNPNEQEKMSDVWPHASLKAQMVTPKGSCPGDNERVMERSPFM